MKTILALTVAVFVAAPLAHAQHGNYAGQQVRQIKALSSEEINQYRSGAGMGYARTAELNRYPGPMHVLELADKLGLSHEQRASTEKLMTVHKAEARDIGATLVDAERALDQLFVSGAADESTLAKAVRHVAAVQGEFRLAHLETHRRMRALLNDQQIERYVQLRGYADTGNTTHESKP